MEQRISLVTLGVDDLDRARTFYEALGWRGQEVERTVFFQSGALVVVLWGRARVTRPAAETSYGGYAAVFTDPDGHAWEVAHNPGFALAADGTLTVPDVGLS